MKSLLQTCCFILLSIVFSLGTGIIGTVQAGGSTSVCDEFFSGNANGLCLACKATRCGSSNPKADPTACSQLLSLFTLAGVAQDVTTDEFDYATCTPAVACPCGPVLNTEGANFTDPIDSAFDKNVSADNSNCTLGSVLHVFLDNGNYRCTQTNTNLPCVRWAQIISGITKEQAVKPPFLPQCTNREILI